MQSNLTLIPTLAIHPHQINFYNEIHWEPFKPSRNKISYPGQNNEHGAEHLLQSKRTAQGKVSKVAKRKMSKSIDYLLLLANEKYIEPYMTGKAFNFKVAFITLTLPSAQIHEDNEIKRKCLNSFIIEIQKRYKVKNYVWRAELQQNGNIHFHLLIDKFIHWNEIRNRWNRIINKLGYVDRYREKMKEFFKSGFQIRTDLEKNWSIEKQKASYKRNKLTDFTNPNSTDIHSLKKIRNIKLYLTKYLTKNPGTSEQITDNEDNTRQQNGRIWGASNNLQNLKGCQIQLDSELEQELSKVVNQSGCFSINDTYYSVHYISMSDILKFGGHRLFKVFADYIFLTFGQALTKKMIFDSA